MFESKSSLCYCLEPRHLAQCALNFFKNVFFVEKQNNAYNNFNALHFKIVLSKLSIIYLSAHLKNKKNQSLTFTRHQWIYLLVSLYLFHFVYMNIIMFLRGFLDVEKEEVKAETLNIKEVLKVIEQCIQAFWEFLETDNRKSWWKFSSSLWINPPVEDPRSLHLLADLTKRLQKVHFK